jgi:hypothetical protein
MSKMLEIIATAQHVTTARKEEIQRRQQAGEYDGALLTYPRAVFGRVECEAIRPATTRARHHWRYQWYLDGKRTSPEIAVAAVS